MKFCDFIMEMAFEQSASIEKIEEQIPSLSTHIAKCWAMPASRDYDHWVKEILNIIQKIDNWGRVKTKSGGISAKTLKKEYAENTNEKNLGKPIKIAELQYKIKIDTNEKNGYIKSLQKFFNNLWVDLEKDEIDFEKCLNTLNIKV